MSFQQQQAVAAMEGRFLESAPKAYHATVASSSSSDWLNWTTATGSTALHHAASKGSAEVTRRLIAAGADLSLRDSNSHTALMRATAACKEETVELLLAAGASTTIVEPLSRDNLLHIAVSNKAVEIGGLIFRANPSLAGQNNADGKCPADLATRAELIHWKAIKDEMDGRSNNSEQAMNQ